MYATRAEADTYFTTRLYTTAWTAAANGTKDSALKMAQQILDARLEWFGVVTDGALAVGDLWPRYGVPDPDHPMYYLDATTVPKRVKDGTCEMALALLNEDLTKDPVNKDLRQVKVGPIDLTYNINKSTKIQIPDHVMALVSLYGSLRINTVGSVKLVRA